MHLVGKALTEGKNAYTLALGSFTSQNCAVCSWGYFPIPPFSSYCPLLNTGSNCVCVGKYLKNKKNQLVLRKDIENKCMCVNSFKLQLKI